MEVIYLQLLQVVPLTSINFICQKIHKFLKDIMVILEVLPGWKMILGLLPPVGMHPFMFGNYIQDLKIISGVGIIKLKE
jgi:hypothetical protein